MESNNQTLYTYDSSGEESFLMDLVIHMRKDMEDVNVYSDIEIRVERVEMAKKEIRFISPIENSNGRHGVSFRWVNSQSQGLTSNSILFMLTCGGEEDDELGECEEAMFDSLRTAHSQLLHQIRMKEDVVEVRGDYSLELKGKDFKKIFQQMSPFFSQIEEEGNDENDYMVKEGGEMDHMGFDFEGCVKGEKFDQLFKTGQGLTIIEDEDLGPDRDEFVDPVDDEDQIQKPNNNE